MSKIKLGDDVRFLNENLAGIVTAINGNIAGVTIEDDFEIPVPLSQLVKVSGIQKNETSSNVEKAVIKESSTNQGVFVAFDRLNDVLLDLKLFNNDSEEILFAFFEENKQGVSLKKSGRLLLNETIELGTYDLENFSTWPKFNFQIIRINQKPEKLSQPIHQVLTFNAKEFHGSYKYVFFLNRQAYFFKLETENLKPIDLKKLQEKDFSEKAVEKISLDLKPNSIVDLHIENLVDNISTLNPTEMIAAQMEAFTKSLDMAHVHKMKSIVFIHGIGNHFLKNKIRNFLTLQKQIVVSFQDADMFKYGGGATEVFLN
jgi:hypothetical protein